jgi:FixJ family two-component response regulator
MTAVAPMVFVVDDDASVRKSVARVLATSGYAVEEFASAADFLAREPHPGPCCLVLDVRMPGLSGLELQAALAAAGRRLSIVFVTGHVDVPKTVQAMKTGAVDLLTKPFGAPALLSAVERAVARDVQGRSDEARADDVRERARRLSPRETQVFALVVTGMLNKQIAGELGIVEKTVKVHRSRVMTKMQAGSVAELVRLADRLGVIVPAPPEGHVPQGPIGARRAGAYSQSEEKSHDQARGPSGFDRERPVGAVAGGRRVVRPANGSAPGGSRPGGRHPARPGPGR